MDFHDFTSSEQFDKKEIYRLSRLDAIPAFKMLKREAEYLKLYRELLKKEYAERAEKGFYGTPATPEDIQAEEKERVEGEKKEDEPAPRKRTRKVVEDEE